MTSKPDKDARKKVILDLVKAYYLDFHAQKLKAKKEYIRTSGANYDWNEMQALVDVGLDFWLTEGERCKTFAKLIREYLGVEYASLTVSGSSANLLAISCLTSKKLGNRRLKPGDEVITTACGFPTTINPIIQNRLVPVFVDVDLNTRNVTVERIKKAIGPKTKAIMIAHTLGVPFPVKEISKIAKANRLWLIEDSCDALGATYKGKKIASFGDIATFSFFPAHQITTGEGGVVVTSNPLLFRLINIFRDWGRDCWCDPGKDNTCQRRFKWKLGDLPYGYDHKYIYSEVGYNLRMTEMQAAVGIQQIKKIDKFVKKRLSNHQFLIEQFKKLEKYFYLVKISKSTKASPFGLTLIIKPKSGIDRNNLIDHLENSGVATRMIFGGNLTRHPAYAGVKFRVVGSIKNSDLILNNGLWVGCHPSLTKRDLRKIVKSFQEYFQTAKNNLKQSKSHISPTLAA